MTRAGLFALIILALTTLPLRAHGVAVDGDGGDWTGTFTPHGGYAEAAGEWGWRAEDANGIQELRATADKSYVYFLVRLADVPTARGDGAPLVQIAVDTDQKPGSGQTVFAGFTRTRLADGPANWERLVRTTFGAGRLSPAVLDANFGDLANKEDIAILVPQRRTLEMRVRWAALGVTPPTTLRLTAVLFTSDARDNVKPEGALALAWVEPTTASPSTPERVAAAFDVYFKANGDAAPPPQPMRVGRWDVPVPQTLREPLLYGAIVGVILVILGALAKLRSRPKSWWWG